MDANRCLRKLKQEILISIFLQRFLDGSLVNRFLYPKRIVTGNLLVQMIPCNR